MPSDNIERAIKRGSGEIEGAILVELLFEGYGPSGAAIMVEALTDNRNRTLQEVRNTFSRSGGSLGESGSVAWQFDSKGLILIEASDLDPEELALEAIDAGAEDVNVESDHIEIYAKPDELEMVRASLEEKDLTIVSAELVNVPNNTVELEEKQAIQTLKLLQKLEELDDTKGVYSNVNFQDSVMEEFQD